MRISKKYFILICKNELGIKSINEKIAEKQTNTFISNIILANQTPSYSSIENVVFDYNSWIEMNFERFIKKNV